MRLQNKTAIITGGATGIGFACARRFVQEGARVALFGRREDRLQQAREELGDKAITVAGDVTREEDLARLVESAEKELGGVDILVNNAGVFKGGPLEKMERSFWNEILDVNLNGLFMLTRSVLPGMMKRKSGSLIHISSILSLIAFPETAAYNASKAAVNQFSRSMAVEYGPHGIRSNVVAPGLIETEMTDHLTENADFLKELGKRYPIGRFGKPEDVAEACLFFAEDATAFITGALVTVDGGHTAT